ncbi:hypothetical protein [Myroides marinus]|uniref:hypothetical protein n=1 Tax=Myroides marinus TaxID=703342 RepID=UPI0025754F52|nr:hypothetical protein [Myroides marinus]MDM1369309.1 hypothetical protein [Myroides marinus]MDM1376121.1 hypothetical protein [Myroides marinus]MDM1383473.1 hypothetical protein [Myroides marinus]
MRNKIVLLVHILVFSLGYAQTGINAKVPMQMLHIDSRGNNPVDRAASTIEVKDDFVVTKNGEVGIGVVNPTVKLEVDGTIRLKDGTEGENKILMSNGQGLAHWEKVPYDIPTVIGNFESLSSVAWTNETDDVFLYSNYKITLTKGRWVVNLGIVVDITNSDTCFLSIISSSKTVKQQSGFVFNTVAKTNTSYAAYLRPGKGFLSGSSIIEVTNDIVDLYVLIRKKGIGVFDPKGEQNYFYATPVL